MLMICSVVISCKPKAVNSTLRAFYFEFAGALRTFPRAKRKTGFLFNLENIIIFQVVEVGRFHSITPSLPVRHLENRGETLIRKGMGYSSFLLLLFLPLHPEG